MNAAIFRLGSRTPILCFNVRSCVRQTITRSYVTRSRFTRYPVDLSRQKELRLQSNGVLGNERNFSGTAFLSNGEYEMQDPISEDEVVNIVFIDKDDKRIPIRGKIGDNAMYLAHRYGIELEGACEACLACSTCHVYVNEEFYNKLPGPVEEEEDMLDMAVFLKPNSRLSCQIILDKSMEGMELKLPQATRNFYVDGHVPQPH